MISQLIKLPNQEQIVNNFIENAVESINNQISPNESMDNFDTLKNNILDNLEKINAFSTLNKINPNILERKFIENHLKLYKKALEDKEISDVNEKLLLNLLSISNLIQKGKAFKKDENKDLYEEYLNHLIDTIKNKSYYKDLFVMGLKHLCKAIYNSENFDNFLANKINEDFVDSLFSSNENYLEDSTVSREINNTLCGLCINSEKLANYIVEKGGLANIIDELKFLVYQDDPKSENIKYSGLKFINTLVNDKANMEKFIELKGANLINKFLKRFFVEDNNDSSTSTSKSKSKLPISDYLTNTTICLFNAQKKENTDETPNSNFSKNNSQGNNDNKFSFKNFLFGSLEESVSNNVDNPDITPSQEITLKRAEKFKKKSYIFDLFNNENEVNNDDLRRTTKKSFFKKTSNLFRPLILRSTKNIQKYTPYLVYCINIVDTNIKHGRQDFNITQMIKNMINLIK